MANKDDISLSLKKLFDKKFRQPTTKQNLLWQTEWRESGAQFRMSYQQFRNNKLREYFGQKHQERLIKAQQLRQQLKLEN
jgi:hypothetical protein